jgi:acyl carrier protein
MTDDGIERVKSLMASILEPTLVANNMPTNELRDDLDLRVAGLVDSLGFVRLLAELETRLGGRVDVAELAPDQLTKVGPLARHIAWRRTVS